MNLPAEIVHPVEATLGFGIAAGDMVTVVGKLFPGRETRGFAHDFVAFDHEPFAIGMQDDPFAAEQDYGVLRAVGDGDMVDKRVRLVRRQARSAMVIAEFIEGSGQAGQFKGTGHPPKRRGITKAASGFRTC